MSNNTNILRNLPKVDELINSTNIEKIDAPQKIVLTAVRETIDNVRKGILEGNIKEVPSNEEFALLVEAYIKKKTTPNLRRVINASGVILHTNLGRAMLSEKAAKAVYDVARGYSNLEYNIEEAKRGSRYSLIEDILCEITGAEAAMAVNNNAAAVMLALGAICKNKEVIISRGELVEIGGSFRIPEIMELSNSTLVEVGTTNKTHYKDYEREINEQTAAILKVHTSNFKIMGFTKEVTISELSELCKERSLPLIHDIGSGSFLSLAEYGIEDEPTVMDSLNDGADVVTFSGDKLLGGPQAGIIVGKKKYIDAMKKHPLTRAVRIDKLTLASLEITLREYLDLENAKKQIPTYQMLSQTSEELKKKAQLLKQKIQSASDKLELEVVVEKGQVGGGSLPTEFIDNYAVAIAPTSISVNKLEEALRLSSTPIIGRISKERLLLDVRTIDRNDFKYIADTIGLATK